MQRPAGLKTTIAIVITFSSLLLLGGAPEAFHLLSGGKNPGMGSFGSFSYTTSAVMFYFGGWGLATGIGLYRFHKWARNSMLVFSILLVIVYSLQAIAFLSMPRGDLASPELLGTMSVVAVFTLGPLALGLWWLAYFLRPRVKELFTAKLSADPSPRSE